MTPLLAPVRFFSIQHSRSLRYNVVIPSLTAVSLTILLVFWPHVGSLTGETGILVKLQSPLAIVGGFFVAALTVVSADRSELMKSPVMGLDPPKLSGEILSRRRFLSFLFGYLSFSAFGLAAITLGADLLAAGLYELVGPYWAWWIKLVFLAGFTFWLAHMAIATLLGLYYFTERLQVSDRRTIVGKPKPS